MQRWLCVLFLFAPWAAAAEKPAVEVPPENQEKGARPALGGAEAMARKILDAIVKDDPAAVADQFFPAAAFDVLKDMPKPRDYHGQLVKWYVADIHREHERLKGATKVEFDGFNAGRCVWKVIGSEGNKLPYWSCYRNEFHAKVDGQRLSIGLKAMINWGKVWYVTHLGPIPS